MKNIKISVSSYSFDKLLKGGEMTQLDCIKKAKEMGFDAIEFAEILPVGKLSEMEYAKMLSIESAKENFPISGYCFGADFVNLKGKTLNEEIARVKEKILIADALGVKILRHDAASFNGKSFDSVLGQIADACREITEFAAEKGIRTTVENHGFFCQDSDRMERLYTAVNHPNFGLLCDMGNFLCADEAPEKAFGKLAGLASYVHAKDFHIKSAEGFNPGDGFFTSRNGTYLRGAIIGHGNVPVKNCLAALKKANYSGYIAVEFEGMEEPIRAISICLDNLKRILDSI